MQINVESFLRMTEETNSLAMVDIEATGLKGDYNSILCVSIKRFNSKPETIAVRSVGSDKAVVKETKKRLEDLECWVTYYGKGFDIPMINTRLLRWGLRPVDKRPHIDMYYSLKSSILTGRRSQGHLLTWFGNEEQKMGVSANVWSEMPSKFREHMPTMIERCESDVRGLQDLYEKTKHLIKDIRR